MKKVLISFDELKELAEFFCDAEEWFNAQPPAPQWIRIEDGLPRHMQRVFIIIKDAYSREPLIHNVIYHCLICPIFETKYNKNYGPNDITHWMPIPPLGEENEQK